MALRGVRNAYILVTSAAGNILPSKTPLRALMDFSQSNVGLFAEPDVLLRERGESYSQIRKILKQNITRTTIIKI